MLELLGHPDRLHQTNKGQTDHILLQLRAILDATETRSVGGALGLSLTTQG